MVSKLQAAVIVRKASVVKNTLVFFEVIAVSKQMNIKMESS
jgi:hypothetical protein